MIWQVASLSVVYLMVPVNVQVEPSSTSIVTVIFFHNSNFSVRK